MTQQVPSSSIPINYFSYLSMKDNQKLPPNFLIAGATKCGSSSLYHYLKQHPEIFLSERKEPRYITWKVNPVPLGGIMDHKVEEWMVKTEAAYRQLFEGVTPEHKAVGEASVDTLYFHEKAIPFIKEHFAEDLKIILILRNPVKRAISAFTHLKRDDREPLDFDEALKAEPIRIEKNYELIYHYLSASLYYSQVKAFTDHFDQVKVIFMEELLKHPEEILRETFTFLQVNPDIEVDTSQHMNKSGKPKLNVIRDYHDSTLRKILKPLVHGLFSSQARERLYTYIYNRNLSPISVPESVPVELYNYFKEDVERLEKLLGKRLDFWKLGFNQKRAEVK